MTLATRLGTPPKGIGKPTRPQAHRLPLAILVSVGLVVRLLTAVAVRQPGYMDAAYYVDGALSLYEGRGFNEPFIWNYLDDPAGIPHPSHLYWMPLSSILAYASFLFFGPTWRAAQVPFVVLSLLLPLLCYVVAYQVARSRLHALCAGLFAVFSGFYTVYWVVPDNMAPFALAGGLSLWATGQAIKTGRGAWFAVAGLGTGLAHMARADGVLLAVPMLLLGAWLLLRPASRQDSEGSGWASRAQAALGGMLFAACYLLVTGPWFVHNLETIGRPLSAAGMQSMWLTQYDDLYSYGKPLTAASYLAWGWGSILHSKLQALWLNAQTLLAVGWMIFLAPFGLVGAWRLRRRAEFLPAWLYGIALYLLMSLAFTFPGWRGAMLHSVVALLPFLYASALAGIDAFVDWVSRRRRTWDPVQARRFFSWGLVVFAVLLSAVLAIRALPKFMTLSIYDEVARWMDGHIPVDGRVMVNDPASFYYYARHECLSIPYAELDVVLEVMARYDARYLLLDRHYAPLQDIYQHPQSDTRLNLVESFGQGEERILLFTLSEQWLGVNSEPGRHKETLMPEISQRAWYLLTACVVIVVGVAYLCAAVQRGGELGFPLDDGWIHQTYARNLAQSGRFAYTSEQASAGSTSPLWTLLLSAGYLLGIAPFAWTFTLGALSWLAIGWASAALSRRLFPEQPGIAPWVGLACLAEWHLAWAAFSGMETALFTALCLLILERYLAGVHPFVLGLIGGALFLTRPEGIVLLGLIAVAALLERVGRARRPSRRWEAVTWLADIAAGAAILLVPYVVFNVIASGQLFPNTFYAKQAEYRTLLAQPVWFRFWVVVRRPLIGAQILLLPGFVWQVIAVLDRRGDVEPGRQDRPWRLLALLPVVWWGVYLAIYALRMPVDYQYGRYVMPTIPFVLIYGLSGLARWLSPGASQRVLRVLSRTTFLALGCLFVAFLVIGGRAYADDVGMINGEMVDVGRWLATHTPPGSLVAAHDIGAIGYFSQRPLLDLAGLVTPEVIPFIRDQDRLLDFALSRGAGYVVTFPSWYPEWIHDGRLVPVYEASCAITRQRGGDHMMVYAVER